MTLPKIYTWSFVVLFSVGLILLNLPLERSHYGLNEYKQFYFSIFLALSLAAYLLMRLFYIRKFELRYSTIDLLIVAALIWNTIKAAIADNIDYQDVFPLWYGTLFYFLYGSLLSLMPAKHALASFLAVILACLTGQLATGLMQYLGMLSSLNGYYAITGTFDNPSPYAIFLSSLSVIILVWLFVSKPKRYLLFAIAFATVLALMSAMVFSRSAIIGAVMALGCFLFLHGLVKIPKAYRKTMIAFVVIAGLGFVFLLYMAKKDSADGRMIVWRISGELIKDHFLTGVGYNKFPLHYNNYQAEFFRSNPGKHDSYGMYVGYMSSGLNNYVQTISEQGIIGLLLYLALIFIVWKQYAQEKRNIINACAFYGLLTIWVSSLFSNPFEHFQIGIYMYSLLALISVQAQKKVIKFAPKWAPATIVALLAAAITTYACYDTVNKYRIWQHLTGEIELRDFEERDKLQLISNHNYIVSQSEALINRGKTGEVIELLEKAKLKSSKWELYINLGIAYRDQKNYPKAEENFFVAHYMIPHLIYPKFLLAKLYLESGQQSKWKFMSSKVLNDIEKIPSKKVEGMRTEIRYILQADIK